MTPAEREGPRSDYGNEWGARRRKLKKKRRYQRCEICRGGVRIEMHHVWYVPWLIAWLFPCYPGPCEKGGVIRRAWLAMGVAIRDRWPKHWVPDRFIMPLCDPHHTEVTRCHGAPGKEYTVAACTRRALGTWKWWRWRLVGWATSKGSWTWCAALASVVLFLLGL